MLTDGINTELIRTDTGLLLGTRVSWSWLSNVSVDCFQSPVVELSLSSDHPTNILSTSVTSGSHNNSVEFFNLDCNEEYRLKVRATYTGYRLFENGNITLFFGGIHINTYTHLMTIS